MWKVSGYSWCRDVEGVGGVEMWKVSGYSWCRDVEGVRM